MKKIIFGATGIAAIATLVFFATNTKANSNNMDLGSLVKINTASAECVTSHGFGDGKCLTLSQLCVGDPGNTECDFGY